MGAIEKDSGQRARKRFEMMNHCLRKKVPREVFVPRRKQIAEWPDGD